MSANDSVRDLEQRGSKLLKEFRDFAMKGNVLDMAVGVILGAAFGKIVSCLVNDVLMPPIGQLMGGVNFADLFIPLDKSKGDFSSLAKAREAGDAELARLKGELRKEFGRLVVQAAARSTGGILTSDQQNQLADTAVRQLAA